MDPLLYVLLFLIVLSGFFSGAEIALFSLSQAKVRTLVEKNERNSTTLQAIKDKPQKLLITILIGNNLVNIGSSALATVLAIDYFGNAGAGIATGLMTFLILFFGEIIPKTIAQRYASKVSLTISPVMRIAMLLLSPLVWGLYLLTRLTQKILRVEDTPLIVSEEDVRAMVNIGHEEGTVEEDELKMIEKVFHLNDISAQDVMTPEEYMVDFDAEQSIEESLQIIHDTGFSRFPVRDAAGEIIGIFYVKDLFSSFAAATDPPAYKELLAKPVKELSKPALFIPDSMMVDDLLSDMQHKRKHIAIVVDEHGAVVGMLTLEDLLEEIVGEITDESDYSSEMVKRIDDNSVEVDPRVSIRKLNALFNSDIHGPEHKTMGWLALKKFGRIPAKGDSVDVGDYQFVVEEADERRIKRLVVIKTVRARV